MVVLSWFFIILGILLALLVLVPVHFRAGGWVEDSDFGGGLMVAWGFGLLSVRASRGQPLSLHLFGFRVAHLRGDRDDDREREPRKDKPRKDKPRKDKPRKDKRRRGLGWAWRARGVFARLLRTLHLRGRLRGAVGTGDPADTALLGAVLHAVTGSLPTVDVAIHPDYLDARLELEGQVRGRLWLLETAVVALACLARRDTRRLLFAR